MAKSASKDAVEGLLKELILAVEQNTIATLALKGVPGAKIRTLVGGEMKRVSHVLKQLKGYTA